jgi:hypothetical protein
MEREVFKKAHEIAAEHVSQLNEQNTPVDIQKDIHPDTGKMTGATLIFKDGRQHRVNVQ